MRAGRKSGWRVAAGVVALLTGCEGGEPAPRESPAEEVPLEAVPPSTPELSQATSPGTLPVVHDAAPRTFVFLRMGAGERVDTMGFEHFAREAEVLSGELRSPGGPRTAYRAELAADGRVRTVELRGWPAGAAAASEPAEIARGTFVGDSLIGTVRQGERVAETRVRTEEGAIPYLSPSVGLMEQVLRRARALGGEVVEVPMFVLRGDGNTLLAQVTWVRPDSVILRVAGSEGHLVVDGELRILRGTNPAGGTRFERVR